MKIENRVDGEWAWGVNVTTLTYFFFLGLARAPHEDGVIKVREISGIKEKAEKDKEKQKSGKQKIESPPRGEPLKNDEVT